MKRILVMQHLFRPKLYDCFLEESYRFLGIPLWRRKEKLLSVPKIFVRLCIADWQQQKGITSFIYKGKQKDKP